MVVTHRIFLSIEPNALCVLFRSALASSCDASTAFPILKQFKSAFLMKQYNVYIMASKRNGTLYTGVASDLAKRVWQHKKGELKGFTSKYKVN